MYEDEGVLIWSSCFVKAFTDNGMDIVNASTSTNTSNEFVPSLSKSIFSLTLSHHTLPFLR